jgi:hypothetical protein
MSSYYNNNPIVEPFATLSRSRSNKKGMKWIYYAQQFHPLTSDRLMHFGSYNLMCITI